VIIEDKVDLLIHQVNLLKRMIDLEGNYSYFTFVLGHNFNEKQMNAILKVLSLLGARSESSTTTQDKNEIMNFYVDDSDLNHFNINIVELNLDTLPTIEEFKKYATLILGDDFKIKHLLLSLKKQSIYPALCDILIHELDELKP